MRFNQTLKELLIKDAEYFFNSYGFGVEWVNFDKARAYARLYHVPKISFTGEKTYILDFNLRDENSLYHAIKQAREAI